MQVVYAARDALLTYHCYARLRAWWGPLRNFRAAFYVSRRPTWSVNYVLMAKRGYASGSIIVHLLV